ncbi:MAG: hypothetical protein MAG715_01227 [Methanonatronarchaeales archaeon]|nr:hypothetical protein [Methanonatronarchaeales archaeon]
MELREEVERYFQEAAPDGVATDSDVAKGLRELYDVGASPGDVSEAADELIRKDVIHVVDEEEGVEGERTYEYHR